MMAHDKSITIIKTAFLVVSLLIFSQLSLAGEQRIYSFGVVPQFEQRKLFLIWQPVIDELQRRTGLEFHLAGSAKIPEFEKEFMAGNYDFAYMNPYHLLTANNSQGYIPLVRDGSRQLKGILVAKKDSNIKKIDDLEGKILAFPAPNALGASLLMRADLTNLFHLDFIPRYVKTHSSVYLHVALGLTSAGGGVMSTFNAQSEEIKNNLRILYKTRPIAPHPITAHPRIDKNIRERVRQAFLEMAHTEKGKQLLKKIPMKKAITASMNDYKIISTWKLEKFRIDQ